MKTRKLLHPLLLLAILVSACGGGTGTPAEGGSGQPAVRTALFVEVAGDVQARASEEDAYQAVSVGQSLSPGSQAVTGVDSKARLDLMPEMTILRMGPNTSFAIRELSVRENDPLTRLQLAAGKLWILLMGGTAEVETPSGSAEVRGSMMSVDYDDQVGSVTATCLEGQCALRNEAGTTEFTDGQAASIEAPGQAPSEARDMTKDEFEEWEDEAPESTILQSGGTLPPPDNLPASAQPLRYTFKNCGDSDWFWTFEGEDGVTEVVVPAGETVSGELPPGWYTVSDISPDGERHGPTLVNSDDGALNIDFPCPPEGGGQGGTGEPGPDNHGPTTYILHNTCAETWHWLFEGPVTRQIDIPPGQTVSGELPEGEYTATDWFDDGPSHGPDIIPQGGHLEVTGCPDG